MSQMSTALGGMGPVLVVILFFHLISLSIALIYLVIRQSQEERKKGSRSPTFFFFFLGPYGRRRNGLGLGLDLLASILFFSFFVGFRSEILFFGFDSLESAKSFKILNDITLNTLLDF